MAAVQLIKIDDRDPSITYSPGSFSKGGNGNEYLSTTSRTNQVGATVRIPFTGTKIFIYGTIDSTALGTAPVSLFSVDGGRATQLVEKQIDTGSQYQQRFYESPDLAAGDHVLIITISSVPSVKASFTFDFAEYYTSPDTTSSSSSSSQAAATPTTIVITASQSSTPSGSSSSSTTAFGSQISESHTSSGTSIAAVVTNGRSGSTSSTFTSPSTSTTAGAAVNSDSTSNAGVNAVTNESKSSSAPAIAGAVAGVIVLLLLFGLLFFLKKRRANRDGARDSEKNGASRNPMGSPVLNTSVTPFVQERQQDYTATSDPSRSPNSNDPFNMSNVSEYYASSGSGRASQSLSSASATGSAGNGVQQSNFNFSKAAEARRDWNENQPEQPPPRYES